MKRILVLAILGTLSPFVTLGQSTQTLTCRPLESTGNFVGPDETIINGNACKVAKDSQPKVIEASAKPASRASSKPTGAVDNARVVEMSKLGLDDDIIIARIKGQKCQFQLDDADLLELKKSGVSPKVVAAMLDATTLSSPVVIVNNLEVPLHTLGQAKVGGRIGRTVTFGVKSVKEKAYLEGAVMNPSKT
ncbi:MAG: hypothetical protein JST77_17850, partial [Acidobacteria bacterium]|nr:hypothetical protein [Acidobacteriota bacterium]